jgi:drug/metabolite transporter (DMT)-like permease
MEEFLMNHWEELVGRQSGPLFFRLVLQPIVAAILAIRAGRNDAREGRRAFFWAFVREPERRRMLLREACRDIGKLFLVGVVLDVIYQLIVFHGLRPVQSLIVATVLAVLPYMVVRGLTNRIVAWWSGEGLHHE